MGLRIEAQAKWRGLRQREELVRGRLGCGREATMHAGEGGRGCAGEERLRIGVGAGSSEFEEDDDDRRPRSHERQS